MNKARKKKLQEAFAIIEQAKSILETVKNEEQESFDNLPEQFQSGARGEEMEGYIEILEEAFGHLDDANSAVAQIGWSPERFSPVVMAL